MPPLPPFVVIELDKRLHQSRDELLGKIHERMDGSEDDPAPIAPRAHMVEPDDAAEADELGDDEARLASHDEATLQKVDAALARLENGGAGICIECGREIPPERMLANPTADTCIECQQRLERERHTGRGPSL
jgi:DnaK suppressor protein